jgi:hypothetical protein
MSNTLLTPTQVTRKALMVLHQKLNFVGTINRGYDDSFAKDGARIGNTLNIRVPNQYTVRTGPTLSTQDTTENSVQLQVSTQKGVDVNFTSNDLTMSLDDFSERILDPAMAVLAANIEADAMNMVNDVYQQINNQGAAISFNNVLMARKRLVDSLAPVNDRTCNLCTQDNDVINSTLSDLGVARAQQQVSDDAAATAANAFGGTRQAVQNALTTNDYLRNVASTTANLNQSAYSNASRRR